MPSPGRARGNRSAQRRAVVSEQFNRSAARRSGQPLSTISWARRRRPAGVRRGVSVGHEDLRGDGVVAWLLHTSPGGLRHRPVGTPYLTSVVRTPSAAVSPVNARAAKRSPMRRWVAASGWSWSGSGSSAASSRHRARGRRGRTGAGRRRTRCATIRASSSRMTCRVSLPAARSAGSPVATNQPTRAERRTRSRALGPGRVLVDRAEDGGDDQQRGGRGGRRGWCRGSRARPGRRRAGASGRR